MNTLFMVQAPWPELRDELQLHHGPAMHDGQPSWTVHDPVRHRFLRVDWMTYEILRRWWLADPALIAEQVNQQTTLAIGPEHVQQVLAFAKQNELVQPQRALAKPDAAEGLGAISTWLLHHYLFFRVALFNPDAWLQRMLPRVAFLGGQRFSQLTLLVLVAGAIAVLRDWDAFKAHGVDLLSWRGAFLYAITLVGVKVAHELGHAFVARHHGCRVPNMGVAFMVMWPMAYTDTTEAWRLADARARLGVALAGVRTELTIAAWATLAWALLPEGPLRTAAFLLATVTWIGTVLINLSPFMRFDGYFVLCDALDQPNLHERSFAMARWWLRREVLGWDTPQPEELPLRMRRAMIAFALGTWAYRVVLYLGIAWLVYHFAFKALGIVLFVVELAWFIALPVWREVRLCGEARGDWQGTQRARHSRWVLAGVLAFTLLPLPSHESAGALMQPAQHLALRLPAAAEIREIHVRPGQQVAQGAPLLSAYAPGPQQRLDAAQVRIAQLQAQVAGASMDREQQARWASLQEELATARDEVRAAREELAGFSPLAPFAGTVLEMEPGLRVGAAVSSQQTLLQLAAPGRWRVVAYASEVAARALRPGDDASFMADARPWWRYSAKVVSVAPHASATLAEPILAQAHGGPVDARQDAGGPWQLAQPLYRVELELEDDPGLSLRQWRGHAVLSHPARSLGERLWTAAGAVLVREFGF